MGWIHVGANRYVNVSHIITISRIDGVYIIKLTNNEVIETTIFNINQGLIDIIPYEKDMPF